MKVSVIVPVYNRADFIGTALRSILRQPDGRQIEVVVVDDGSEDRSAEIVSAMAARFPSIRLIRQRHHGVATARNEGLRHLSIGTSVVTFLDSDDVMPEGRIAADLSHFVADRRLEATYGLMTLVDAIDEEALAAAPGCRSATVRGISLSAGLFRTEVFTRLGGFDESFAQAEDTDFLLRLFEGPVRWVQTDTIAVLYRRHPGNLTNDKAAGRRSMMQAALKSSQRRKANPGLTLPPGLFDLQALSNADWI